MRTVRRTETGSDAAEAVAGEVPAVEVVAEVLAAEVVEVVDQAAVAG